MSFIRRTFHTTVPIAEVVPDSEFPRGRFECSADLEFGIRPALPFPGSHSHENIHAYRTAAR